MTLQTVKLSQLRLAPENVRKVKPKAIDQLAADMLAHGQLQNLVGYAEGKLFYVAAGGRRYRAFKKLEKAKSIPSSHPVSIDVRDKAEAIELSLAENVQNEAMHIADAVGAYGDLVRDEFSPEDIAGRFGVALSYVKKVLRLAALHPQALACLARDQIGMDAAQALTLTDDHDRQLEALKTCGNSAHNIRRMLTAEKLATDGKLFQFVGAETYEAAGGSVTRDLFAEAGVGYADDPELVLSLATAKLDEIADSYRAAGWSEVRATLDRPDDYYNATIVHTYERRDESEAEQTQRARIAEARAARQAEIGEGNYYNDRALATLALDERALDERLLVFSDEQKAESAMLVFIGQDGGIEAKPIRTKRAARAKVAGGGASPDYSGPTVEALTRIKTLAVQEAVATDHSLALDILLDCLAGQIVHGEPAYQSPVSLRLEGFNAKVPDDLMTDATIAPVEAIGADALAALPARERFAFIRAMESPAKSALFARLVAGLIDGGLTSGTRRDLRHSRFERIAFEAGLDMAQKWQAPPAFFARLRKPVMLKVMADELGQPAADNCAKMKKGELAIAAAERLAGRGWLPPALVVAEPPAETPRPRFDWQPDEGGEGFEADEDFGGDGVDPDPPGEDGIDGEPDEDDAPEDEAAFEQETEDA